MRFQRGIALAACSALALGVAACGSDDDSGGGGGDGGQALKGNIAIDGSSTVFPFAQAAAEQFQQQNADVKVTVGQSGTGGGFEKFCAGETQISDASRPIKPDEEVPICEKNKIAYGEYQVANDGVAVVTNKDTKIDCMTTDQLTELWGADSKVKNFSDIDPKFPDQEAKLFGPGTDSGTFDFFTDEINGEEGVSRKDYEPSEDDNVLVQGVGGTQGGLGYFGYSFYAQNQDKLNLVAIDDGNGCIKPSPETIQDDSYKLARPLFQYVSDKAIKEAQVKGFVDFAIENNKELAEAAQLVPMTEAQSTKAQENVKAIEAGKSVATEE